MALYYELITIPVPRNWQFLIFFLAILAVLWGWAIIESYFAHRELLPADASGPALLRRNIVVEGMNLLALRSQEFELGTAVLVGTGNCAPCSQMEKALGPGGYNAMRGHGGITASVIQPGVVRVGDSVTWLRRQERVVEYDD